MWASDCIGLCRHTAWSKVQKNEAAKEPCSGACVGPDKMGQPQGGLRAVATTAENFIRWGEVG